MRAVELFVGAGGMGIGISRAGFTPTAVIERNRYCCNTILENQKRHLNPIVNWPLIEGNIQDVDFRALADSVELVSGGPPCQPFSIGGKHRAYTDARDMFPEAVRAVRELQPKAFLFENVKGLTRASFASYFEYIRLQMTYPEVAAKPDEDWVKHLSRLECQHTQGKSTGLHYRVVTRVLNAANYGVPQRRERVFFVGFRADLDVEWSFPETSHSLDALLWDQDKGDYWDRHKVPKHARILSNRMRARAMRLVEKPSLTPWKTVRDALIGLPDPENTAHSTSSPPNHFFQPGARSYIGHTGSPLDEPAKTLKAGVHGVPGGENMLRRPDGTVRYFTVRESARLQTFPDNFVFHGSWSEAMRQLGNAVPVSLAELVATNIYRQLEIPKSLVAAE